MARVLGGPPIGTDVGVASGLVDVQHARHRGLGGPVLVHDLARTRKRRRRYPPRDRCLKSSPPTIRRRTRDRPGQVANESEVRRRQLHDVGLVVLEHTPDEKSAVADLVDRPESSRRRRAARTLDVSVRSKAGDVNRARPAARRRRRRVPPMHVVSERRRASPRRPSARLWILTCRGRRRAARVGVVRRAVEAAARMARTARRR